MLQTLGNTITADMGLLPGFALVGPLFGLPASLLAGVLERPFITRAGAGRHAVWYSIQANLISLLVGYLLIPFAIGALHAGGLVWIPISIAISTLVEYWYLEKRGVVGRNRWGLMIVANLFSAIVLFAVMAVTHILDASTSLRVTLYGWRQPLTILTLSISIAGFLLAFAVPMMARRRERMMDSVATPISSETQAAEHL